MGKCSNIKDCLCDEKAKEALNVAFIVCDGHGFHGRCSTKSRNKATLVARDRLNQYIVSILNNSNKPTTAVSLLVKKENYAVCRSILTKITNEEKAAAATANNTNDTNITKIDKVLGTKGGITSTSTIAGGALTDPGTLIIAASSSSASSTHNNNPAGHTNTNKNTTSTSRTLRSLRNHNNTMGRAVQQIPAGNANTKNTAQPLFSHCFSNIKLVLFVTNFVTSTSTIAGGALTDPGTLIIAASSSSASSTHNNNAITQAIITTIIHLFSNTFKEADTPTFVIQTQELQNLN